VTPAAIAAGFAPRSAKRQAHRLLRHPGVRERIDRITEATMRDLKIDRDRVLAEIGAEVKVTDRLKALEMLGRYLRLFVDVVEIDGGPALIEAIERGRRRMLARTSGETEVVRENELLQ
jgi:hypothetical protein